MTHGYRRSLARSNHTLTILANKAYIFGGETTEQGIASTDIHAITLTDSGKPEPDYHLIPALPGEEGEKIPEARTKHAACAFEGFIAVYGGCDEKGEFIKDGSSFWLFNPEKTSWSLLTPSNTECAPGPRYNAKLFVYGHSLVLFGGYGALGNLSDVWLFDADLKTWTQLASAPISTTNAALANGQLYLISGSDPMSSQLHHLDITSPHEEQTWQTFTFPTNPIAPGPRPRHGGGLLAVTTGFGRNYLTYFLGAIDKPSDSVASPENETHDKTQWSDMWTLQLPSSDLEAKPKLSVKEAIKPAKIKDAIRSAFGAETGKHSWAEVELKLPDPQISEGKLHPGPRGFFGCDVMGDGRTAVLWGGRNAKGELVGDGWIMKLE